MSDQSITTKSELLAEIDKTWPALSAALDRLTEAQLTKIRDPQGWAAKDHLVHLTRWERSMVFMLQGQPRHTGLGVAEAVYLRGDDDATNAAIYQQAKDLLLHEVLADFRNTHHQLMTLIAPLTDADLQRPYRHFLPNEPGDGDGPPIINLLYGNTADHFAEHLGWIEALVTQ